MNALLVLLALAAPGASPEAWPGFLGAGASGINPQSIPLAWTPTKNIAWQAKLPGKGQSSPVIWGNRAFITTIDGAMKDTCLVIALDLADGRIVWKQEIESSQKVRSNYFQSRSAPTPVVDGDRVFAFFETGDVVALSHDGKLAWQRSLVTDYGEFEGTIGLAASPLLTGDSIVILVDHEGPSYLIALDKHTGSTRWQTERTSRVSYASPALVTVGNKQQVVCSSSGTIDGYDPETGKLLWSHEGVGGNRSATPLPFGDGQFLVAASPGMHNEREAEARKSNFAMQIDATGTGFAPKITWSTEKAMPAFNSPVVYQGHAYWVNKVGVVYCFDAKTGEERYAKRIRQMIWASPVGIGDRVYFFGKDGLTTVLAAGPEFKVLSENPLWDGATSIETPATEGDHQHGSGSGRRPGPPDAAGKPSAEGTQPAHSVKPDGERPTTPGGRPAGVRGEGGSGERPSQGPRGLMFADPVQYGVAIVSGSLLIRTGDAIYCVREMP